MKLFLYDSKHENVFASLDLGHLSGDEYQILERVIDFLDANGVTNLYKTLVLAEKYVMQEAKDEDGEGLGETEIVFD